MATNHILIVDDLPKNIQVVANILKPLDYKITFAQSGVKALEILDKVKPDLILLDVMMPELNGFETCQRIKEQEKFAGLPIIFLTAKNDIDSITKAFEVGGVDFISKPFNNKELIARVKTHLNLTNSIKLIQKQNEELEGLNATKDKFFSIIAHDLRNPFNALYVLTDILKTRFKELPEDETLNMIELLNASAKDGYELLENLLTWSKAQRNKLEFHPMELNLENVIAGNIQLLSNLAGSKEIKLVNESEGKVHITADHNMIDTVLRNLITNAIKFTPVGGKVSASVKEQNKNAVVEVKDTGVGIKQDDLDKLFKIESGHSTLGTKKEKGTGMGLVLCKEFIENHNGKIWVESEYGEGSSFYFSLPIT